MSKKEIIKHKKPQRKEAKKEIVSYDPLQRYLSEIRQYPKLSKEEEFELAKKYRDSGDLDAAYKLVMANLKLVVIIAKEYQRNVQKIVDLIQEGNIGLMEAVKKFDPFKETKFSSYAVYWIRAYMLRYLINNVRLVKVGTTQAQRKLFYNLKKEQAKLEREGFVAEAKLLAKRLNVKESEVIEMQQRLALPDLSVDAPINKNEEGANTLHSVLSDDSESIEQKVIKEDFANALRIAIDEFKENANEKEIAIIDLRLFTQDGITLREIADKFGVSRERIRQIEKRLKTKLKEHLQDKLDLSEDGEVLISEMLTDDVIIELDE